MQMLLLPCMQMVDEFRTLVPEPDEWFMEVDIGNDDKKLAHAVATSLRGTRTTSLMSPRLHLAACCDAVRCWRACDLSGFLPKHLLRPQWLWQPA